MLNKHGFHWIFLFSFFFFWVSPAFFQMKALRTPLGMASALISKTFVVLKLISILIVITDEDLYINMHSSLLSYIINSIFCQPTCLAALSQVSHVWNILCRCFLTCPLIFHISWFKTCAEPATFGTSNKYNWSFTRHGGLHSAIQFIQTGFYEDRSDKNTGGYDLTSSLSQGVRNVQSLMLHCERFNKSPQITSTKEKLGNLHSTLWSSNSLQCAIIHATTWGHRVQAACLFQGWSRGVWKLQETTKGPEIRANVTPPGLIFLEHWDKISIHYKISLHPAPFCALPLW